MTGIRSNYEEKFEETPYTWYKKKHKIVKKYGVIQVGVTCFVQTNQVEPKSYTGFSYTFWISPFKTRESRSVTFDSSAVEFLNATSNPDWNKFVKAGIGYTTQHEYEHIKERYKHILQIRLTEMNYAVEELTEDEKQLYNDLLDTIIYQISEMGAVDKWAEVEVHADIQAIPLKVQYHLGNYCKIHYWNTALLNVKEDDFKTEHRKNFTLVVFEHREAFREYIGEVKAKLEEIYLERVGFTEVFQYMLQSKKVLVGHNCFYDILFLFEHFNREIPADLLEFKTMVNNNLVNFYDTKLIQEDELLCRLFAESYQLSELYKRIKEYERIDFVYPAITQAFAQGSSFHNAGYDSLVTGYIFLKIKAWFDNNSKINFVRKFKNLIYMSKSLYSLNISGNEDPIMFSNRERLYYVKILDVGKDRKKPSNKDIKLLMKLESDFTIRWNREDDFFIYLSEADANSFGNRAVSKWLIVRFDKFEVNDMDRRSL